MQFLELFDIRENKVFNFEVSQDNFNKVVKGDLVSASILLEKKKERQNLMAAFRIMQTNEKPLQESDERLDYLPSSHKSASNNLFSSNNGMIEEFHDSDLENNVQDSTQSVEANNLFSSNNEVIEEEIEEFDDFQLENNLQNRAGLEETGNNSKKLWNANSTKILISLCRKYDKEFETGVKKFTWTKIAAQLSGIFKIPYTYQQCDTKFKVQKNIYKTVKKHNEQSGNNKKTWEFFDDMHDIMFTKPEIKAVATCSSARGLTVKGATVGISDSAVKPQSDYYYSS